MVAVAGCGALDAGNDDSVEEANGALMSGAPYKLTLPKMSGDTGNCVNVAGGSPDNGAAIQEWDCNGSGAQQFVAEAGPSPYYRFKNASSGKCLNIYSGVIDAAHPVSGNANGAPIQQWTCGTADNNYWELVSYNGGFQFRSKLATADGVRRCLDVTGGDTKIANGTRMELWSCGSSTSAKGNQTINPVATSGGGSGGTGGTGGSTGGTGGTGGTVGNFPARFSAPYVPTWNNTNLANLASSTGNKFWTLAFIIPSGGGCTPSWNGEDSLTGNSYGSYINSLRSAGGDVIISFGGQAGGELGKACGTVSAVQGAYQKVIDQFHLKWMDLDIESGLESDSASVDRRNKALHNLQVANPGLRVNYTLAVDRSGLPSGPRGVLSNAKANGVNVSVVNIMAMDYGPCYTDMGQAAIDAAVATRNQLASLGLSAKVGVTPMIGVNDVTCEKFSTSDASTLVNYAQSNSYISLLAYWEQTADPNRTYINIFKTFH
jgi:hypothetical protein